MNSTVDAGLTAREKEILALIVRDYTCEDIGEVFAISRRTVEVHRAHIREKVRRFLGHTHICAVGLGALIRYAILYEGFDPKFKKEEIVSAA